MPMPFVSRALYDRERELTASLQARAERAEERADKLAAQILTLKKKGYEPPREKSDTPPKPPSRDVEAIAREGAKQEFIDRMTADFVRMGTPEKDARAEATRMADEMYRQYGEE